jgi:hypothetical protein
MLSVLRSHCHVRTELQTTATMLLKWNKESESPRAVSLHLYRARVTFCFLHLRLAVLVCKGCL